MEDRKVETILKTNDLTKKYDSRVVVDNLNIEIKQGILKTSSA